MANFLYDFAREGYLGGDLAWDTDDVRVIAIDTASYTPSAAHTSLSDVAGGARKGVSASFGSKTITAGVADAADITTAVSVGGTCTGLLIYKHTGTDATSTLICWLDHDAAAVTFSLPTDGGIAIAWSNGGNKIFKL